MHASSSSVNPTPLAHADTQRDNHPRGELSHTLDLVKGEKKQIKTTTHQKLDKIAVHFHVDETNKLATIIKQSGQETSSSNSLEDTTQRHREQLFTFLHDEGKRTKRERCNSPQGPRPTVPISVYATLSAEVHEQMFRSVSS
ncbi:UNVERIFIED_CONTAM: hypothetical protein NCL1_12855 [Trichonephila clavipes]